MHVFLDGRIIDYVRHFINRMTDKKTDCNFIYKLADSADQPLMNSINGSTAPR